jgi:secondary thiamine-phosphate synthase enzyme
VNRRLDLHIDRTGLHDITRQVAAVVASSGVADGLSTVFVQHTSASLIVNEGADPSVRRDLEAWLARLVPEGDEIYTHNSEGPDDMPSHIRAMLTGTSVSIPIVDGKLALGTWQGIFLWEHRRYRSTRKVIVHVGP